MIVFIKDMLYSLHIPSSCSAGIAGMQDQYIHPPQTPACFKVSLSSSTAGQVWLQNSSSNFFCDSVIK